MRLVIEVEPQDTKASCQSVLDIIKDKMEADFDEITEYEVLEWNSYYQLKKFHITRPL